MSSGPPTKLVKARADGGPAVRGGRACPVPVPRYNSLIMGSPLLSVEQIQARLTTRVMGQQIHYFASVGSTNDEAKRLAAAGAPEGTLVFAGEQTAGRGRLGRRWNAPPNLCLLMSLVFRPSLPPAQAARLTMLCSIAIVEAIQSETGLHVGIKWPNDLVVAGHPSSHRRSRAPFSQGPDAAHHRKLAGILTETIVAGTELAAVIVGMGINVNVDPAALGPVMTPATSLLAELGRPVDRVSLLLATLGQIESRYGQVASGQIHNDWRQRLVTLGHQVTVTVSGEQLSGVAEDVNPDGALSVRDLAGNLHLISAGDVALRPGARTAT